MIDNIVVVSRIRLARNISHKPFSNNTSTDIADGILTCVFNALEDISNFDMFECKNLKNDVLEELLEDHLISSELINNSDISGVAISEDRSVSIMINEEDHIREQCFLDGLNLKRAYDIISDIDTELVDNLDIAYDEKLGFLTACPSNVGTGLRASVMMFLPGIVLTNNVDEMINAVKPYGVCVRGCYGEGTSANGYLFQISNQISLGKTEEEIVQLVESTALKIVELEKMALNNLLDNRYDDIKDEIYRDYGILTNCYKISSEEAIEKLSKVKMGLNMGVIEIDNPHIIDQILNNVSRVKINKMYGNDMDCNHRDICRAEYIRNALKEN